MADVEKSVSIPRVPAKFIHDGEIEIDYMAEKKLVRKLDLYIIPVVMLLYLLSFLDR